MLAWPVYIVTSANDDRHTKRVIVRLCDQLCSSLSRCVWIGGTQYRMLSLMLLIHIEHRLSIHFISRDMDEPERDVQCNRVASNRLCVPTILSIV